VLLIACNILGTVPYMFLILYVVKYVLMEDMKISQIEFDSIFNRVAVLFCQASGVYKRFSVGLGAVLRIRDPGLF
jgi:hypothetical protein